jgi:hypothetical protein
MSLGGWKVPMVVYEEGTSSGWKGYVRKLCLEPPKSLLNGSSLSNTTYPPSSGPRLGLATRRKHNRRRRRRNRVDFYAAFGHLSLKSRDSAGRNKQQTGGYMYIAV